MTPEWARMFLLSLLVALAGFLTGSALNYVGDENAAIKAFLQLR